VPCRERRESIWRRITCTTLQHSSNGTVTFLYRFILPKNHLPASAILYIMEDKVLPTVSRVELTGIIKRLEAATSRLEDIATSTIEAPRLNGAPSTPAPTGPLPAPPVTAQPPKPVPEPLPESVEEFDSYLASTVKKYVALSDALGGPIAKQVGQSAKGHTI
jgi:hypothetical protein